VAANDTAGVTVRDRNFDAILAEGKRSLHLCWKTAARLSIGSSLSFILIRLQAKALKQTGTALV